MTKNLVMVSLLLVVAGVVVVVVVVVVDVCVLVVDDDVVGSGVEPAVNNAVGDGGVIIATCCPVSTCVVENWPTNDVDNKREYNN